MRAVRPFRRIAGTLLGALALTALSLFLVYTVFWRARPLSEQEKALRDRFLSADLAVCVLDVGQADCIVLRQGESVMLIDSGDPEDADEILETLSFLKIKKIDMMLLTHPHSDHIGSAKEILETIPVECVSMPDAEASSSLYKSLCSEITDQDIPVLSAEAGVHLPFGECEVCVLSPDAALSSPTLNAYSVVVRVEYEGIRMLFTGDAEAENEQDMLESGEILDCDFVKIGHHGSESSSTQAFIDACSAEYAVVTTQYQSPNELPKQSVLDRWTASGAQVLCTHRCGAVCAFVENGTLSVDWEEDAFLYD